MIDFCINKYNKLHTPSVVRAGRIAFYLGLLFEIVIFSLDRADWINPYQSYMFRITFVLFLFKCLCTKYDKRQIIFIILTALFSSFIYLINGKDECVRVMVFIIAMKDLDLKRTLRLDYFLMSFSIFVLGLLSICGIMGDMLSGPGYAEKENAFMVAFGLGSSNTWAIQIWVLVALMVYLYHDRFSKLAYPIIFISGILVYALSKTKAALLMFTFTALFGFVLTTSKKIRDSKITYIFGGIILFLCVGFSAFAAKVSNWWEFQPAWELKLDNALTGRINSLYAYQNGGAVLSNWKLFGSDIFVQSFDMGWVRLFWWYGIIPGILMVFAVLVLIYDQYIRKDYMGYLLTISIVVFTVLEAHFISVFICRSYLIFMFGNLWYRYIVQKKAYEEKSIAFYIGSLNKGGAERVFCNLAEYFYSIGYHVTLITQYKKDNEYEVSDGIDRIISDITPEESKGRLYNMFARLYKLHKILMELDADLLMTTVNKNNFNAIMATAFIRTRVVVSIVADPYEEYYNKALRLGVRILFPEADGIIMQTTQSLSFFRAGLKNRAVILPNSVSPAFERTRYEGERAREVFIVGRMDDNKNQEMAIRAFAIAHQNYPDSKLTLIGDGDNREYLEKLCQELNIAECVYFTGLVSDVPDRLLKAYAFLLTSYTEGMPNTLLEAMSLGVAVISTDCPCGGPHDIIKPMTNGILIPVGDVKALSDKLELLFGDPGLTNELGCNAYESMKEYRADIVNEKWRVYFEHVMSS